MFFILLTARIILMEQDCFAYALKYLSRYPKTSYELTWQLKKKWFSPQAIDDAVHSLQEKKFLDDRLYAEMYLRSEVVRKWKPLFVIEQKLKQKWIEQNLLVDLMDEMEEELTYGQKEKIRKLFGSIAWDADICSRPDDQQCTKFSKKMQSRGYRWDLVKEIVGEIE